MAEISTEIAELNMGVIKGDTFNKVFTFYESDGTTPLDLTGFTGEAIVRASSRDTPVLEFNAEDGVTISPLTGEVTLSKSSSEMNAVPAGSYVWTFSLTDSGSEKRTYIRGKFVVSEA